MAHVFTASFMAEQRFGPTSPQPEWNTLSTMPHLLLVKEEVGDRRDQDNTGTEKPEGRRRGKKQGWGKG